MTKSGSRGVARLLIGVALIAAVVWWVGAGNVAKGLSRIHPLWIIPILATSYIGIAISCLRWRLLLAARGIRVSVHLLIFYYVIGYFFSSFLPGMFGGDVVRGYVFGKEIKSHVESFASVFMERLTGLAGLVAVALVACALNFRALREAGLTFFMAAIFIGFALFLLLLFNRTLVERIGRGTRSQRLEKWRRKFLEFHDAIRSFRARKRVIAFALLYSVLFQFLTSVNTYIVCLALQLDVSFLDIMVVVPIILLICLIPSTPNATGVWELAFTVFFSRLGVDSAGGANIALVLRAKNILVAILGGFFYILSGRRIEAPEKSDERA